MIGMPSAYIYLYHLDRQFNIPVTPDQITNSLSVSYSQEPILGRSAPQITYSSSGPRTQSLVLQMHRQAFALENNVKSEETDRLVDEFLNGLLSATVPKYLSESKAVIPPSILCRFGNETCIRGVVSSQVQVTSSGPWLKNGKMAMVQVSFEILEIEPFSADYVMENGLLRSVSVNLARSSVWKY